MLPAFMLNYRWNAGIDRTAVSWRGQFYELTESDLKQIDQGSSKLKLEGERLPEAALKMTGG
jgi:hypothetical protein